MASVRNGPGGRQGLEGGLPTPRTGRDGGNVASRSAESKDRSYYRGRRARQPETIMCGGA